MLDSPEARRRPSYIPNSLLKQDYKIINLEKVNYYSQLVFGYKFYDPPRQGSIKDLIGNYLNICWLVVGLRVKGII